LFALAERLDREAGALFKEVLEGGPWSARGFDFLGLTRPECKSIVIDADQPSE
jgi:hypothetical protein